MQGSAAGSFSGSAPIKDIEGLRRQPGAFRIFKPVSAARCRPKGSGRAGARRTGSFRENAMMATAMGINPRRRPARQDLERVRGRHATAGASEARRSRSASACRAGRPGRDCRPEPMRDGLSEKAFQKMNSVNDLFTSVPSSQPSALTMCLTTRGGTNCAAAEAKTSGTWPRCISFARFGPSSLWIGKRVMPRRAM